MNRTRPCLAIFSVLFIGSLLTDVATASDDETSYYLIGNSLTWDTVPSLLDGDVQWHVDCGKSLPYIYENPEKPCVKTSTLWPTALKEKQYDLVSVQSHYGATLEQDIETISKWMQLQPSATFIVHTGWAHHEKRVSEYNSKDAAKMQHSPAYIDALLAGLKKQNPGRTIRRTYAMDLLAKIASDIKQGKAPLKDVAELHRDAIHVDVVTGRYLMHNTMRHALGQPRSQAGFEKLDVKLKKYLDSVLDTL